MVYQQADGIPINGVLEGLQGADRLLTAKVFILFPMNRCSTIIATSGLYKNES